MKSAQISPADHASRASNGDDARWRAVLDRDARQDGKFFYAVSSTGVFCRPSCPARRPRRGGVVFFATAVEAERAGFRACIRCRPLEGDRRAMLAEKLCRYIETHADEPLTLAVLGDYVGITQFHLQRTFKRVMGVTPREYAAACRMRAVKKNLRAGQSVTQALFAAGYGSTSRLYERSRSRLGMTPATYGRKGRGARIRYAITDSALGKVLLAATDQGVCCLQFGDSERDLVTALKREFAEAELLREEHEKLEQHHCSVFQTIVNGRVWHLAIIEFGVCIGLYTLSFWGPQLLKSVSGQHSNSAVGVLVMIPHLVGILAMVLVSRSSDRLEVGYLQTTAGLPRQANLFVNGFHQAEAIISHVCRIRLVVSSYHAAERFQLFRWSA